MGNDLDTSNVKKKQTLKSFQNRLKPTNSKNQTILHVSQKGMIVGFSEKCYKLFTFSSATQKVSFQSFCPSFQVYLNDSISNLLPTLAKSAVNSMDGNLDLVWLFKVRIRNEQNQIKNKQQTSNRGAKQTKKDQKEPIQYRKEKENQKNKKKQKQKQTQQEPTLLKTFKNSRYFWSFVNVQPFLVKGNLYFEVLLQPTFKPVELLRKRKLILKVKQKNRQIEERIRRLKKKTNNSLMSQQTSKTQQELRDLVNNNNQKTKTLKNLNLEIHKIEKDMTNRKPDSKKFQQEKLKLLKGIKTKENQLTYELKQTRVKQLNTSIITRLNSLKLQLKHREEERQNLKFQIKENASQIEKQNNHLLKLKNQKLRLILKSEQFQSLSKKKKFLVQKQKKTDKDINYISNMLKNRIVSQNIREEISKTSNKLKKLSKNRNSLIREIDKFKNILKIHKSNSSISSSSSEILNIIEEEQQDFLGLQEEDKNIESEFLFKLEQNIKNSNKRYINYNYHYQNNRSSNNNNNNNNRNKYNNRKNRDFFNFQKNNQKKKNKIQKSLSHKDFFNEKNFSKLLNNKKKLKNRSIPIFFEDHHIKSQNKKLSPLMKPFLSPQMKKKFFSTENLFSAPKM
ncbi:hypothetical protein M0813_04749 [Anaeramoeba flamelloides]|uniref:Uncharacterized protein n=1 Tax=Anaeramoeba flamelloides TaxID=1746091 RepID=A0ABQ8XLD8_9EUKA|nr:hypothetical protein M0813_04749 [Anaeramoeba flamelloides]